ncbi:hypothetical protein [Flavobacterium soyangense]|uniref:Uncharacterized protein n=1 Tax=Flavobacterium soyangense TaxID=2023265 RepID=A0A930U763_9FLAO|nr:hypothetical protein [Flavobacterium soyangense]MBF2708021.1 hypothetical protein [Flavobacterium soyangense]
MNKLLGIFILSILSLSCSSDLDFNQVNNLKLEPVFIGNLATFDVQANQFVIGGVEQTASGDFLDFDVFRDTYFTNALTRADFFFEINNTINRAFKINLVFFDANNLPLYSIPFDVPANASGITKTEIFQNSKLDLLKRTAKIGFVIKLPPGVPFLTENSLGSLKLRSKATIYLVLE